MGYFYILLYHQLDILLGLTFALYQVQAPQWEPKRVLLEPAPLESDGIHTHTYLDLRKGTHNCPFARFLPLGRISCEGPGDGHFLTLAPFGMILLYFP